MEINWILIGIVLVFLIILIIITIRKNQKDKKELTQFLNNDFKKEPEEESDSNEDTDN